MGWAQTQMRNKSNRKQKKRQNDIHFETIRAINVFAENMKWLLKVRCKSLIENWLIMEMVWWKFFKSILITTISQKTLTPSWLATQNSLQEKRMSKIYLFQAVLAGARPAVLNPSSAIQLWLDRRTDSTLKQTRIALKKRFTQRETSKTMWLWYWFNKTYC